MAADEQIRHSLFLLLQHMEQENFKGYDPYDGLTSPLFRLPFLSSNHKIRFYGQQLVKRSPVNLRPLLQIKKNLNPVTLGLAIQAYAALYEKTKDQQYKAKVAKQIQQLHNLQAAGFHGACWGYDFPWEARYATVPALQPTVVATGIISHGLFQAYQKMQLAEAGEMVVSTAKFVLKDLNRKTETDDSFCFSYSPFDREMVFNASMKGVRILSEAYALTGNQEYISTAANAVKWVMNHQDKDGAWIYSKRETGKWVDNYHTGYILDCLDSYITHSGDESYRPALNIGLSYYLSNFITDEGIPKFYNKEIYPIDCTAAGQTLLTLVKFGKTETACSVAKWMHQYMQSEQGYFYFRKYKSSIEKVNFMRWSNAWMLAGLSELYQHLN